MFEKSIFLLKKLKKIPHLCYMRVKTVILVKCPFRHNTSPARSKNCWDGRGEAIQLFLSVEPHSYTQRDFFFSKLHLSLSERIIIGVKEGQNFRFVKKISEICDTKLSLHCKVTLGMFYRLTNLYSK